MKKVYVTPAAMKLEFDYSENVVASGNVMTSMSTSKCGNPCEQDDHHHHHWPFHP